MIATAVKVSLLSIVLCAYIHTMCAQPWMPWLEGTCMYWCMRMYMYIYIYVGRGAIADCMIWQVQILKQPQSHAAEGFKPHGWGKGRFNYTPIRVLNSLHAVSRYHHTELIIHTLWYSSIPVSLAHITIRQHIRARYKFWCFFKNSPL